MDHFMHARDCPTYSRTRPPQLRFGIQYVGDEALAAQLTIYESCKICRAYVDYVRELIPQELLMTTLESYWRSSVETFRGRVDKWAEQPLDRTERLY